MKNGELKVYYKISEKLDTELDKALKEALERFSFRMWASGVNIVEGVRDLAFKKGKP